MRELFHKLRCYAAKPEFIYGQNPQEDNMGTTRRGWSWIFTNSKLSLSVVLILLGVMTTVAPARADTTYTFQGVTLHKSENVGLIPGCVGDFSQCFGDLWDGDAFGAITGEIVLDGSPVNGTFDRDSIKFASFSNGRTITSDDDTFWMGGVLTIENGQVVSWQIELARVDPVTGDTIFGEENFQLRLWSACVNTQVCEFVNVGRGSEGGVTAASYDHGRWAKDCGDEGDPCVQARVDPILGCVIDDGHGFSPDFWNDGKGRVTQDKNNCYAYATNKATNTFAQPGLGANKPELPPLQNNEITCDSVEIRAEADGLSISDCNLSCTDGSRKIALVVDLGDLRTGRPRDYHWYREDSNGQWSHKPGRTPAINVDCSGQVIDDPRTANRDCRLKLGLNYTEFCSCFCTRPTCDETIQ